MKKYLLPILMVLFFSALQKMILAQVPKKTTVAKPMVKFKPPVVQSFLGNISGSNAVVGAEQGKQLATQALQIKDAKGTIYTIASYQFAYHRLGVTEDEQTGKLSPQADMVSNYFTETPLPRVWQNNIKDALHKGEGFHFFDIIVLDKEGRRFFAPELKITIQ